MPKNKILALYQFLRKKYCKPGGQWSFWCKWPKTNREKERIIIEAILTQRTNWKNVELAMANLKKARLDSLRRILRNKRRLVLCIKPSGFYKQKSRHLIGLAKFILSQYGGLEKMAKEPILKLRAELLKLKGVGPETADSILLYALEKPVFVIDEYTKRLLNSKFKIQKSKFKYLPTAKYEDLQKLFESNLPRDWRLYQDFHALIVIEGKDKKREIFSRS